MQSFTLLLIPALVGLAVGQASRGTGRKFCEICDSNARCEYLGNNAFECLCNKGFEGYGLRGDCKASDPCKSRVDNCDSNADCIWDGISPAFTCACKTGFTGDGLTCTDIDECTLFKPCDFTDGECVNTFGSYRCRCDLGYVNLIRSDNSSNLAICVDLNECEKKDACPVKSICTNTEGSYSCRCLDGYDLSDNGLFCKDINECEDFIDKPCNQSLPSVSGCKNYDAGFECLCNAGFEHPVGDNATCKDINECEAEKYPCDEYAICENTEGNYNCSCVFGYTEEGKNCTEIEPSLSELNDTKFNLTELELNHRLSTAFYQKLKLENVLEIVERQCALKKAGLPRLPKNKRVRRDVEEELEKLLTGTLAERETKLTNLIAEISELSTDIAKKKVDCALINTF